MHRKIRQEPAKELLTELQGELGAIPAGHQHRRERKMRSSILWAQELGFCENIVWSSVAFNADSDSIRWKEWSCHSSKTFQQATCRKGIDSQFTTVRTSLIQGCQSIVAKNTGQSMQLPWVHWSILFEVNADNKEWEYKRQHTRWNSRVCRKWRSAVNNSSHCYGPLRICFIKHTERADPLLLQFMDTIVCTLKTCYFLPFQLSEI